jgi:hypothetical protein
VPDPRRAPHRPHRQPAHERQKEADHPDRLAVARQEAREPAHDSERGQAHVPDRARETRRRRTQEREHADAEAEHRGKEDEGEEDEEHVGDEAHRGHEAAPPDNQRVGEREAPRRPAVPGLELEEGHALDRAGLGHVRLRAMIAPDAAVAQAIGVRL